MAAETAVIKAELKRTTGIRETCVQHSHRCPPPQPGERSQDVRYYWEQKHDEVWVYAAWCETSGQSRVRGVEDIPAAMERAKSQLDNHLRERRGDGALADLEDE